MDSGGPGARSQGRSFAIAPGRLLPSLASPVRKEQLALAVLGALGGGAAAAGEVRYRGQDLLACPAGARRPLGPRLAMVFQDPGGTLNPGRSPVGEQVVEVLREHEGSGAQRRGARWRSSTPSTSRSRRAHRVSAPAQRRSAAARVDRDRARLQPRRPDLDEPTTGLDVTTEARFSTWWRPRRALGSGILYITHNLGVVARLGDEVAVMYAGEVVEQGPVRQRLRPAGAIRTRSR